MKLVICNKFQVNRMNCVESRRGGSDWPPSRLRVTIFSGRLLGLNLQYIKRDFGSKHTKLKQGIHGKKEKNVVPTTCNVLLIWKHRCKPNCCDTCSLRKNRDELHFLQLSLFAATCLGIIFSCLVYIIYWNASFLQIVSQSYSYRCAISSRWNCNM